MIKTKETTIDGKNFKVTQLGYSDGVELLTKLLSIAGSAFDSGAGKESFSLGRLATNLKANDLKSIIERRHFKKRRFPKALNDPSNGVIPPDIPWRIYRIAMSKYFRVSPTDIEEQWSIDDVEHLEWVQMKLTKTR